LKKGRPEKKEQDEDVDVSETPTPPEPSDDSIPSSQEKTTLLRSGYRWLFLALIIGAVAAGVTWKFYLSPSPIPVAALDRMKYPLPDKPSIAVLPFVNLGGDAQLRLLCDGLVEGLIDALSRSERLFVIARNSTAIYKNKTVTIKQVAEDLGVRYVVEGSAQGEGNRVRITIQLIDALSGQHLFSERYDRELKDFLVLQDDITMRVLNNVRAKLLTGEEVHPGRTGTKNLEAYLRVLQAREFTSGARNKERLERARQLLEEARALDPNYAASYAGLAGVQINYVVIGASESPWETLRKGVELGKKALSLDDSNAGTHAVLAINYTFLRQFDDGLSEARRALALSPNSAFAYYVFGWCLFSNSRFEEAIPYLQKSLRLSPKPIHSNVLETLGGCYRDLGRYEEAVTIFRKALEIYGPDTQVAHRMLAQTYALMGNEKEARAEGAEVLRIDPNFRIDRFFKGLFLLNQVQKDRMAAQLRMAGLK
jgi:adenylate cyclase